MEAVLRGPSGRTVLGPAVLTIGRAADNRLVVNDTKASSHHAEMRPSGQGYSITDLGSTNGTFVNDQPLERNVSRPLNNGDRIRVGDTVFTYEITGATEIAYGTPGSFAEYPPTIAVGSSEHTAYGQDAQQPYAPLPEQYAPPPPPVYQPYAPPLPPQQPPYGAAGGVPPYGAPVQQPYAPPPAPKKQGGVSRILLIALAIIVVLGGVVGFLVYHALTLPPPVISVTSKYAVGSTPAGSTSTMFHVSGQKFAANSAITFLLDGTPAPGAPTVQSDANGNVMADLTITNGWSVGNHTLTARDAGNDTTKSGISVTIVPQGQAHTPGPNGAPPDDMTFSLQITVQHHNVKTNQQYPPLKQTLMITGRPDPAGGTVCQQTDHGQPQTYDGTLNSGSISFHETYTETCSGTYKDGKLSYTQTVNSDQYSLPNNVTCTVSNPYPYEQLQGAFTALNTISGSFSLGAITAPCSNGSTTVTFGAEAGTWTGQM